MTMIGKTLGGTGLTAAVAGIAAVSVTALLVIVGAVVVLALIAMMLGREAARSSTDDAARRWTWILHGRDPDNHADQGPSP